MKKSHITVLTALLAIMGIFLAYLFFRQSSTHVQDRVDLARDFELTGILREMNLGEEMMADRFLIDGRYELTQLNIEDSKQLPFKTTNLFLEKFPKNTAEFLGKCVTVKGRIDSSWVDKIEEAFKDSAKGDKYIYDALVFLADDLVKNDFSKCNGYAAFTEIPQESTSSVVTGTIQRFARVVPDVGPYDYVFVFNEPYTSQENSSGEPQVRDYMPIAPQNNDIWVKIENKVDKPTALEVHELWGYVESKYLLVTRVME